MRGSVIGDLAQSGSLKCLFPRGDDTGLQAVLLNTAGGVTGGDRFATRLRADPHSRLTTTTQAAERIYRASPGETGHVTTRITVGQSARVNWLPQETILFDGCALDRLLAVDLGADASVLLAETLIFGRAAMGETLRSASLRDRIEIRRLGDTVYLDAMALHGDIAARLARPGIADGAGALATVVLAAPGAEAHLDPVRAMLPDTGGVSLIRHDLLALRLLAADSWDLRRSLVPVLTRLNHAPLPKCWMI